MARVFSIQFQIVSPDKAVVSVMDRSFLYGDSVYEVVRTYRGAQIFLLDRHYRRLLRSANRIGLQIPFSLQDLERHLSECMVEAKNDDSYIRIVVSRGTDTRFSLLPNEAISPTTVIVVEPLPTIPSEYYSRGVDIGLVSIRRNHPKSVDPSIKTGNYMNNMMALVEASKQGGVEAVMLNQSGEITEATTSNVFMVKHGRVLTPALQSGLLEGVTRGFLKEILAKEKISFEEKAILESEFLSADEIFLTGTIKEIMPVKAVNGKKVGQECPGPITTRLMKLFHAQV